MQKLMFLYQQLILAAVLCCRCVITLVLLFLYVVWGDRLGVMDNFWFLVHEGGTKMTSCPLLDNNNMHKPPPQQHNNTWHKTKIPVMLIYLKFSFSVGLFFFKMPL